MANDKDCMETAKVVAEAVVEKIKEISGDESTNVRTMFLDYFTKMIKETATGPNPADPSRSSVLSLPSIMEEISELKEEMEKEDIGMVDSSGVALYIYARSLGLKNDEIEKMLSEDALKELKLNNKTLEKKIDLVKDEEEIKATHVLLNTRFNQTDIRTMLIAFTYYKEKKTLNGFQKGQDEIEGIYKEIIDNVKVA